nr:hypothetical protein [Streptomyces sp. NA04227]
MRLPRQPEPAGNGAAEVPPQGVVPPGASEATRLLCGGCYLDSEFRDAVIDELYVHEERLAAPAHGYDAARVLAHALRSRRLELGWAAGILGLWVVGAVLTQYLLLAVLLPCLLLALAARLREGPGGAADRNPRPLWGGRANGTGKDGARERASGAAPARGAGASLLQLWGQLSVVFVVVVAVLIGVGKADGEVAMAQVMVVAALLPGGADWVREASSGIDAFEAWASLVMLLLVAVCVAGHRAHFARTLTHILHPRRFADITGDPAESAQNARYQRLRVRIRTEQSARLVMYHSGHPFCGAGVPVDSWTLAVELRPDPEREEPPEPLSNRKILDNVRELLARLRLPAPAAAAVVRDRLRGLEIDECVFLPVTGLPRRELAPYGAADFARHRAEAVEEGGETRRHFLRVRVGGWEEEVVTTVFVRVHTQGGMLMLEIAPHVLAPVRREFEEADRIAHDYRNLGPVAKLTWALARVPQSLAFALRTLNRGGATGSRTVRAGQEHVLPDGPAVSVRELGSGTELSLFQEMDVQRYLKAIQDRVAHGVRQVLRDAGYRTDEFAQKIVNISDGGVHIEHAQGAFAIGDHNTVSNQEQPAASAESPPEQPRQDGTP